MIFTREHCFPRADSQSAETQTCLRIAFIVGAGQGAAWAASDRNDNEILTIHDYA